MGKTGSHTALVEGVIRSVYKEVYGKGPRDVYCTYDDGSFSVHCEGVLTTIGKRLARKGGAAIAALEGAYRELFTFEQELITGRLSSHGITVTNITSQLDYVEDRRMLVITAELENKLSVLG